LKNNECKLRLTMTYLTVNTCETVNFDKRTKNKEKS
jgi:hypothetical protein